ncbi:hypothetical protein AMECASPLE_038458 [Ameca splendens]|uniref:Uncharacterized protein n=1 Tax=Ameca splendens TaxID=208324 RepID=A0ABV0XXG2_9TELE
MNILLLTASYLQLTCLPALPCCTRSLGQTERVSVTAHSLPNKTQSCSLTHLLLGRPQGGQADSCLSTLQLHIHHLEGNPKEKSPPHLSNLVSVALFTFPWKLYFFLTCTDQQDPDSPMTPLHFPVY